MVRMVENRQFHKCIILTRIVLVTHDAAIRREELLHDCEPSNQVEADRWPSFRRQEGGRDGISGSFPKVARHGLDLACCFYRCKRPRYRRPRAGAVCARVVFQKQRSP